MRVRLALTLLALLAASTSRAAADPAGVDLFGVFASVCLANQTDSAGAARAATAQGFELLRPREGQPGLGMFGKTVGETPVSVMIESHTMPAKSTYPEMTVPVCFVTAPGRYEDALEAARRWMKMEPTATRRSTGTLVNFQYRETPGGRVKIKDGDDAEALAAAREGSLRQLSLGDMPASAVIMLLAPRPAEP